MTLADQMKHICSGRMYNDLTPELMQARERAVHLTNRYNAAFGMAPAERESILRELLVLLCHKLLDRFESRLSGAEILTQGAGVGLGSDRRGSESRFSAYVEALSAALVCGVRSDGQSHCLIQKCSPSPPGHAQSICQATQAEQTQAACEEQCRAPGPVVIGAPFMVLDDRWRASPTREPITLAAL